MGGCEKNPYGNSGGGGRNLLKLRVSRAPGDGVLNFFDVSAFLGAFFGGDVLGDWNKDGVWNFFDVSGFLTDFQSGCP